MLDASKTSLCPHLEDGGEIAVNPAPDIEDDVVQQCRKKAERPIGHPADDHRLTLVRRWNNQVLDALRSIASKINIVTIRSSRILLNDRYCPIRLQVGGDVLAGDISLAEPICLKIIKLISALADEELPFDESPRDSNQEVDPNSIQAVRPIVRDEVVEIEPGYDMKTDNESDERSCRPTLPVIMDKRAFQNDERRNEKPENQSAQLNNRPHALLR